MKKTSIYFRVLILSLLCFHFSFAQKVMEHTTKKTELGLKIGGSSSYFVAEGEGDLKNGFILGAYYKYNLSNRFQLQVEAYYTQLGTISFTNLTGDYQLVVDPPNPLQENIIIDYTYDLEGETTFKNDYIVVPILLKYNLAQSGVDLNFGVRFGYLINDKTQWAGSFEFVDQEGNNLASGYLVDDVLNGIYKDIEFKKIDYSISYGVSYNYKKFPISIDFRGNYGLNNINKSTNEDFAYSMKNMSYELTLFFKVF